MKIRYTIFCGLLSVMTLFSCRNGYEYYDGLYVSWTMGTTPLYTLTIDDVFPKTVDLTVASSELVDRDITIQMQPDPSLVAAYNDKYHTNYEPVPDGAFVLTDPVAVIREGNFSTTEPIRFSIVSREGFQTGRNYMMPVTIMRVSDGYRVIEASRTIYIALTEVIVRSAVNFGSNGYVGTMFSATPAMPHGYDLTQLTKFSFEARIYMHSRATDGFNTIMGLEENLVLRVTTYSNAGGIIELTGGGMSNVQSPNAFPVQEWVHVAAVYDGNDSGAGRASIYLNGEQVVVLDVQRDETRRYINLLRRYDGTGWVEDDNFMIGESVSRRYLNGVVSEARVWAKALTAAEIRGNMCAVVPESEGLIGYWLFDEAGGNTFLDATGHGYDMTRLNGTMSAVENVRCPEN